ncbi:AfsA-related hotdog domain-containing protein [Streptomyces sp. NPDC050355]|uniref:AfsA-related hotdog domain-containing protein n=1 Tax=Streptomyces sp. NPDC050355 TaxID=3365609 RepID=UPI0037A715E2
MTTKIVADRFHTFAENEGVLTLSQAHLLTEPATLTPGLGIGPEQWADLVRRHNGTEMRISGAPPRPVDRTELMKLHQANVLLGDLQRTGHRAYRAELITPDNTEMIQDHSAQRQHIPGMLLMEVCCQFLIAATRRHLAELWPGVEYHAVMQHFDLEFQHFAFPLPAQLMLTIDRTEEQLDDRIPFEITIELHQSNRRCLYAHWRCQAMRSVPLFKAEARQAIRALASSPVSASDHIPPP